MATVSVTPVTLERKQGVFWNGRGAVFQANRTTRFVGFWRAAEPFFDQENVIHSVSSIRLRGIFCLCDSVRCRILRRPAKILKQPNGSSS